MPLGETTWHQDKSIITRPWSCSCHSPQLQVDHNQIGRVNQRQAHQILLMEGLPGLRLSSKGKRPVSSW